MAYTVPVQAGRNAAQGITPMSGAHGGVDTVEAGEPHVSHGDEEMPALCRVGEANEVLARALGVEEEHRGTGDVGSVSGVVGGQSGEVCAGPSKRDVDAAVNLMSRFESVARCAYDVDVVKALAGNTNGLRAYFERAERLAVNTLSSMVQALDHFGADLGDKVAGTNATLDAGLDGTFKGYPKPATCWYPDGYCYLDWAHDYALRLFITRVGSWPPVVELLNQDLEWFDLKALCNTSITCGASERRVHVVSREEGGVSAFVHLVAYVKRVTSWRVNTAVFKFKAGSLGAYLNTITEWKPVAGAGIPAGAEVGGTGEGEVPDSVRNAVLDDLIERCSLTVVDRSRLWEAVQLAGNGVTHIDGRPLLTGNKVLALLGDSVLKTALVARGTGLRIGDIQAAVGDVLSNGCLAQAAKVWMVGPLLQGALSGRPSDYVLATAMEAIAAACYYGGGIEAVDELLARIAQFTGRVYFYPWLAPAYEAPRLT